MFEVALACLAPYFPGITQTAGTTIDFSTANSTTEVALAAGFNPFSTLGAMQTFQLTGSAGFVLSLVTWGCNILAGICFIALVRGK